MQLFRNKTNPPKITTSGQDVSLFDVNPLYSEGHSKRVSHIDFGTPKWFSDRYGSHLARDIDVLFDSPKYGLQLASTLQEGWLDITHRGMFGVSLFTPQPEVYQKKGRVPSWLLFHTSPEIEGRFEKRSDRTGVVVMSSKDLSRAITHFQKEIRDPSLGLLKDHLGTSLEVEFEVEVAHKKRGEDRFAPVSQMVKIKFNPWYRTQLYTLDYD